MKKSICFSLLLALLLACVAQSSQAQTIPASYYPGNWNFQVKDLPDGDMSGVLNFSTEGNGLKGYFVNTQSTDTVHIDKIAVADSTITLYFSTMGQDINLTLHPRSDTKMEGSVMGMFAFTAEKKQD